MKKGLCIYFCCFLVSLIVSFYSPLVFGIVECDSDIVLTEETKVLDIVKGIMVELDKISETDTLRYTMKMNLGSGVDRSSFCKELQTKLIERLDAVNNITPSVKTALSKDKITFEIVKYVPASSNYYDTMGKLVSEAKKLKSDVDKMYYLNNYFYDNGFTYAYDNAIEFEGIKSSSTYKNLNAMPDSVLVRKKAICMGFANVAAEYLTELGIPNIKIRGHNIDDNGYHVWNVVYFEYNGKLDWYCVDFGYSIYRKNSPNLIKTFDEYVATDKYVWESTLLEDAKKGKYDENLLLIDYFKAEENVVVSKNYLEYSKKLSFLENVKAFYSLTAKDLFNISLYFTNIYDKMIYAK